MKARASTRTGSTRAGVAVLALAAGLALAASAALQPVGERVASVLEWTAGRGAWTAVILAALWIPAAVLLVPGSLVTLGTGFLLGFVKGTVVVSIGSTLGAAAAFWIGRTLGRDRVRRWVQSKPRFAAVDEAVARDGLPMVLLTRLSPLFPYNFLNYAYGVTRVPFRDFLLGSWAGMIPGTLLYVAIGSGARTLAAVTAGSPERSPAGLALFAAGIFATIAAVILIARRARRVLAERIEAEGQ